MTGHIVEGPREAADLVARLVGHPLGVVTRGDLPGHLGHVTERAGDPARHQEAGDDRGDHGGQTAPEQGLVQAFGYGPLEVAGLYGGGPGHVGHMGLDDLHPCLSDSHRERDHQDRDDGEIREEQSPAGVDCPRAHG